MIPFGSKAATTISSSAKNPNFLFIFKSSNRRTRLTYLPTCSCQESNWGFEYDEDPGIQKQLPHQMWIEI